MLCFVVNICIFARFCIAFMQVYVIHTGCENKIKYLKKMKIKKFSLTLIVGLACFPLFGQLIERDADKLVIGNSIIKREMAIKDRQCFTQSIKISNSGRKKTKK